MKSAARAHAVPSNGILYLCAAARTNRRAALSVRMSIAFSYGHPHLGAACVDDADRLFLRPGCPRSAAARPVADALVERFRPECWLESVVCRQREMRATSMVHRITP